MPQIIVTARPASDREQGAVMLRERVNPEDFESERFAANLVERLGWAVVDATEVEHEVSTPHSVPEPPAPAPEPEHAEPEPVGTA